jgi:DNA-binding IclR family transcriptional regulator
MRRVGNASAARHALDVLKLLSSHAAPMPAAAIARELALPRSSVYHLLAVLRAEGFVVHLREQRRYGLGVSAFELGSAYARQEPLRWVAHTVLAGLVESTGHNGHFAILHGRDVLYIIEERAAGRPSLVTDVGVRLPAHLTASGLAILAALQSQQLRAVFPPSSVLVQRHGPGPQSLRQLRRVLGDVRRDGYAREDGFVTPGFASVASAVLDHSGHPIASVALTFPRDEVDAAMLAELGARVVDGASRVAERIRGRPAPAPSGRAVRASPAPAQSVSTA